jgi:mono/diheme cytochrome c family protein
MRHRIAVAVALTCLWSMFLVAIAQTDAKSSQNSSKSSAATKTSQTDGERRFQANCGRCHNPPESISPREARAVVRHMRVRAMLSAEDEKLILKFLAP